MVRTCVGITVCAQRLSAMWLLSSTEPNQSAESTGVTSMNIDGLPPACGSGEGGGGDVGVPGCEAPQHYATHFQAGQKAHLHDGIAGGLM